MIIKHALKNKITYLFKLFLLLFIRENEQINRKRDNKKYLEATDKTLHKI